MPKKMGGNFFDKTKSKNPLIRSINYKLYKDVIKFLLPLDNKKILDIGCGEGYFIKYLIKNYKSNFYIEGGDISDSILKIAKENNPNISFKKTSIYKSDYKDNSFDIVIAMEVLEHLENPMLAINELKRISKDSVIITVPREPFFRFANILRLKYLKNLGNAPGHINHWTKNTFKKFLNKSFDNVKIKTSTLWLIGICKKE